MSIDRENYLLITTLFFTDSYSKSREALVPTPAETWTCSAPSNPQHHANFAEQKLCEKLNEHDGWRIAREEAGVPHDHLPKVASYNQQVIRITPQLMERAYPPQPVEGCDDCAFLTEVHESPTACTECYIDYTHGRAQ